MTTNRKDEATKRRRPSTQPGDDGAPIKPVPEPVRGILGPVEMTELNLSVPQQEIVRHHDADDRAQEYGKRFEHFDESNRRIDELPGLADPGRKKGNEGASADIDILWKQACKVDTARDGVSANVFEGGCKCKAKGEEEDTGAGARGAFAAVHHDHEKVWWVPYGSHLVLASHTSLFREWRKG